jgi:trans-2,3-dihydro-3-hydroxyanthranilate isomerase
MIRLKQNTGPVAINIIARDGQPELVQFSLRPEPVIDRFVPREIEIAEFLNIPVGSIDNKKYQPMMVSCGFPYLVVPLTSYRAVRDARFDLSIWGQTTAPATSAQEILLFSNQTANSAAKFHARLVGPRIGVGEDPPIGSSIPAFTSYLCAQSNARRGSYRFAVDRGTRRDAPQSVAHRNKQQGWQPADRSRRGSGCDGVQRKDQSACFVLSLGPPASCLQEFRPAMIDAISVANARPEFPEKYRVSRCCQPAFGC